DRQVRPWRGGHVGCGPSCPPAGQDTGDAGPRLRGPPRRLCEPRQARQREGVTVKLSDWVFQFIAELGVKHVFMVTGGGAMHLNDSLGQCIGITYVCALHEQAAAMAAESYAKVTNGLGVCLVTAGPGGTNAITGVAGGW